MRGKRSHVTVLKADNRKRMVGNTMKWLVLTGVLVSKYHHCVAAFTTQAEAVEWAKATTKYGELIVQPYQQPDETIRARTIADVLSIHRWKTMGPGSVECECGEVVHHDPTLVGFPADEEFRLHIANEILMTLAERTK